MTRRRKTHTKIKQTYIRFLQFISFFIIIFIFCTSTNFEICCRPHTGMAWESIEGISRINSTHTGAKNRKEYWRSSKRKNIWQSTNPQCIWSTSANSIHRINKDDQNQMTLSKNVRELSCLIVLPLVLFGSILHYKCIIYQFLHDEVFIGYRLLAIELVLLVVE